MWKVKNQHDCFRLGQMIAIFGKMVVYGAKMVLKINKFGMVFKSQQLSCKVETVLAGTQASITHTYMGKC